MKTLNYLTIISLVFSVFACSTLDEQEQEQKRRDNFLGFIATLDTITLPFEADCGLQIEPVDSVFNHKYQDYIVDNHTALGIINTFDSCYFVLLGYTLEGFGPYLWLTSYNPEGKIRDFKPVHSGCFNLGETLTSEGKMLIRENLTIETEKTRCSTGIVSTKESAWAVNVYETTSKLLRLSDDGMIYTLKEQKTRKSDEHNKQGIPPIFDKK